MKRLALALLLVVSSFVAGMVVTGGSPGAERVDAESPGPPAVPRAPAGGGPDFTAIAAHAVRAVSNISSVRPTRRRNSPFANDPFFQYFFGDTDVFGGGSRRELSLGSGVVVSADGYVLTNNHVVGDLVRGTEISVVLPDRRERPATVVGVDEWTDIALLKIDAAGLPVIPWGDSSKLKVAEWVLAIGNPFQLNQSVTLGIVSAVGRANLGVATYEDFIQTDAAINPGNSGGALVNSRGELVGINTAIFSQHGGYQGIGFAVPSNLARRVMDDLIRYGEVRRGSIGYLEVATLTSELARQLGVGSTRGAVIVQMIRDSAAYEAGFRPGDVIVSFDGTSVDDAAHFNRLLADTPAGRTVTIGIVRGGVSRDIRVLVSQSERRRRPA